MNEVAGLERNSAREGAKGSASANDLAVFEAGEIDSLAELRIGTQLLEGAGLERRAEGSRRSSPPSVLPDELRRILKVPGKLQNEAES